MSDLINAEGRVGELAEDFLDRHRRGLRPSVDAYIAEYPDLADEIRRLFPALLMMEELKPASGDATGSFDGTAVVVRGARLERLGDFRILREVGRGGMGVVYEAEQESLGRRVALKVLTAHHLPDPAHLRRFEREARAAARLHHTNIVPVFGVGQQEGLHYYVMQFIQGLGLDEVISELKRLRSAAPFDDAAAPPILPEGPDAAPTAAGLARSLISEQFAPAPSPPDEAPTDMSPDAEAPGEVDPCRPRAESPDHSSRVVLGPSGLSSVSSPSNRYFRSVVRIGLQVARALEYAHTQGIFHRDVKPSNLLLDLQGTAWVADFGLAKAVEGDNLTHTGDIVGTIRYMAPERFRGTCDTRSDVYALGLTMYEMLALRPAFEKTDRQALIQQVTEQDPPRLRRLNPAVPRDLETVVHKAIDKDPSGRYPTAAALAEDLELYLDGRPIHARSTSTLERCWKWAKRRPTVATLLAGFVIAVLTGLAAVTWQWRTSVAARNDALEARNDALSARDQAQQNFELARKAVDDYLTRVGQNTLLKEQGLHELRQDLLETALGYYRDFLRQRGDDPKLRAETAAAHERVGDIQIELGRPGEALTAYDQALVLIEPLVRERTGDPLLATAQVRLEAGRLQALRDVSYRDAIVAFDRVKTIGEELLASGRGTADLPEILARTYQNATFLFRNTGRADDGLKAVRRAHELAERAVRDRPGDVSAARTLLDVSTVASELLLTSGHRDEAQRLCEQGIALGKAPVREHPRDVELRMHVAALEYNLGMIEQGQGHRLEALKFFRHAADTLGALARENPQLIQVRSNWAYLLFLLGNVQCDLDRYAEAEQSARASIDLFEALAKEIPSSPYYQIRAAYGYGTLGKVHLKMGSHGEALAMMRKVTALLDTSVDVQDLYNMACNLALASTIADPAEGPATAERQRRDADRAVATLRRAIGLGFAFSDIVRTDPDLDSLRSRPDFQALQALLMDRAFPADPFSKDRDALR